MLAFAAAGGAQAQQQTSNAPPNALQGFSQNRNQPVNIKSISLEVRDKNKVATFTGNVHLVQGDTTLRCKTLIVRITTRAGRDQPGGGPVVKSSAPEPNPANSSISHMEAIGNVIVTQKEQTATGDRAVYDMKADTVTLKLAAPGGFVAVTQGVNGIVRSDKSLIVHLASGVSHFDGRVVEGAVHAERHQGRGQVRARARPRRRQIPPGSDPQGGAARGAEAAELEVHAPGGALLRGTDRSRRGRAAAPARAGRRG